MTRANEPETTATVTAALKHPRMAALDAVRATSICAVLAAHLLPIRLFGIKLNESVGVFGMALFFVLSGYLITTQLLKSPPAWQFLKRRMLRVVPIAWLCIALVAVFSGISDDDLLRYLTFTANFPPQSLHMPLEHLWSLCVEVQFYVLIFLLLLCGIRQHWLVLPTLLVCVTTLRVIYQSQGGSLTWFRADDLLAGALLALIFHNSSFSKHTQCLGSRWAAAVLLVLLLFSSLSAESGLNTAASYVRPYLAAAFVMSLIHGHARGYLGFLASRTLQYIASISYALYIWHPPLAATWLGSGEIIEKYAKRPLLFATLLLVAHLSTYYFEAYFTRTRQAAGSRTQPRPAN